MADYACSRCGSTDGLMLLQRTDSFDVVRMCQNCATSTARKWNRAGRKNEDAAEWQRLRHLEDLDEWASGDTLFLMPRNLRQTQYFHRRPPPF